MANAEERRRTQRLLYRQCLRTILSWGPAQQRYCLAMEGLEALVRPSLRAALPQMRRTMTPVAILRFIFKFHLPTDTVKMQLWCSQAGFAFLKRARTGDADRRLICGWAAITSPSFTALDAAVLVAYIHRHYNPFLDARDVLPPGMGEGMLPFMKAPAPAAAAAAGGQTNLSASTTVVSGEEGGTSKKKKGSKKAAGRKGKQKPEDEATVSAPPPPPPPTPSPPQASTSSDQGLEELLTAARARQEHRREREERRQTVLNADPRERPLPSLDAFSEPILVKLEALTERCRSAIPAEEQQRPERHARLIVQSVLDVLRWESSLLAYHGACGGSHSAPLNAIDEVLLRRQSSHRMLAVIVAHILASLGVRAVALCHDRLPLVAVYSARRQRSGRLQCCVDVANTAILGPEETREALAGLNANMSTTALGVRLLQNSESVVAQAASLLSAMKRDRSLSAAEYEAYDKAARYITFVVDEEVLARAVVVTPPQ